MHALGIEDWALRAQPAEKWLPCAWDDRFCELPRLGTV